MKKNTWCIFLAGVLVIVVVLSGCEMILPPTTYESQPTKVRYDLSYGYRVTCTGTGRYEITYLCDTPEVLIGTATYTLLYPTSYNTETLSNNTFIRWNISGNDEKIYELGLTVHVEAESYLVSDLKGGDALTIQEIQDLYPALVQKYTQVQANGPTRFIDPENPDIITIAERAHRNTETNNSFLVAKSLFIWLKQNTLYQAHPDQEGVQPAAVTLQKKTGDCDDLAFLYISLCRAVGIPARFIRGYLLTVLDNGAVTITAHAWIEVFVGELLGRHGWIPVESASVTTDIDADIHQNFGVEDAFHLRLFTDDGSNESLDLALKGISYTYDLNSHIAPPEQIAEVHNYEELQSKKLVVSRDNTRRYE